MTDIVGSTVPTAQATQSAANGPRSSKLNFATPTDVAHKPAPPSIKVPSERVEKSDPIAVIEKRAQHALAEHLPKHSRLQITRNEDAGAFVYKAIDDKTGEVVRQFPSEEVLRRMEQHHDIEGLAVDETV